LRNRNYATEARPWISDRTFLCIRPGDASARSGRLSSEKVSDLATGTPAGQGGPCVNIYS